MNDTMSNTKAEKVIWEEKNLTELKMNGEQLSMNVECDITGNTQPPSVKQDLDVTTEEKISGIYKIINKVNGKYYVGSSNNIYGIPNGRWYQHKMHLKYKVHYNKHLQSAWNKYGESNFDFVIIEKCIKNDLLEREQYYLNTAKLEIKKCYNKSFLAERPEWTNDSRQKRSIQISGKNNPNYGNGNKIKGIHNPFFGKKHSTITKNKMSVNHKNVEGINNSQYDSKKYLFHNNITNEQFYGTRYDFRKKFNNIKPSGLSILITQKSHSYKNWIINHNL